MPTGFSLMTCLPALSAARISSGCAVMGSTSDTASMALSSHIACSPSGPCSTCGEWPSSAAFEASLDTDASDRDHRVCRLMCLLDGSEMEGRYALVAKRPEPRSARLRGMVMGESAMVRRVLWGECVCR